MTDPTTPPTALRPETVAVVAGRPSHTADEPLNVPVHLASTYVAGGELEYGRYGNPSWTAFEDTLGALEGGRCVAFASGIAAVSAVLDLVPTGGRVVAPRALVHGHRHAARRSGGRGPPRRRVRRHHRHGGGERRLRRRRDALVRVAHEPGPRGRRHPGADRSGTRARRARRRRQHVRDPLLQQPIADGVDLVVHSATKYISGHSDVLMGAVIAADPTPRRRALTTRRSLGGAIPSALEAFLALRGLRTLPVRMERAQATAAELVARLAGHPALDEVRYPGFGAIISIVLRGGAAPADALVGRTRLWIHATSLGGVESTFERRRRWAAEAPTIPDGLVRLSVGLEHVDDLFADLVGRARRGGARGVSRHPLT